MIYFKSEDSLFANGIGHCLMESTGIYWLGLYNLLTSASVTVRCFGSTGIYRPDTEERKTDRKDCALAMAHYF